MDFIYNAMMASVKTPQERTAQTPDKKSDSDGFQKLLDEKKTPDNTAAASGPEQPQQSQGEEPQEAEAVQPVQDPRELEKRMAMAAMAMAQNPEVAELAADIAEETPQVLTDPNWEDGFIPVGYDDYDGYRIVHWMKPEAAGENLQAFNQEAGKLVEQQQEQQTEEIAPETLVKDSVLPKLEEPKAEVIRTDAVEIPVEDVETLPEDAPAETPVFEDVRAVPVKVAEAPAEPEQAETESIGKQIGQRLIQVTSVTAEGNGQSITVRLDPANLGKVQVEVSLDKDGVLRVSLSAENSRTAGLLERHSGDLAGILGRYAGRDVEVEVPRQENQQRQDLYDQQQERHQQQRQQEQQHSRRESGEDFLHQLRLGLIPVDGEII